MKTALEIVEEGRKAVQATSAAYIQGNANRIVRAIQQELGLLEAALGNCDLNKAANYAAWIVSRSVRLQTIIDDTIRAREKLPYIPKD